MTKREDESDRRNPEWMWVTVAGTRNLFPGRKQHEPVYGSIFWILKPILIAQNLKMIYFAYFHSIMS